MKFEISNIGGSIILVRPLDTAAIGWLAETAPEGAQFFGRALAVEPRYLGNVLFAIGAAGGEVV